MLRETVIKRKQHALYSLATIQPQIEQPQAWQIIT
jgi:hypothetical protein